MAEGATTISGTGETASVSKGALVVLGRLCFVLIFVMSSANLFTKQMVVYAALQGVPLASVAVPIAGVISLAGGLSILVGYQAKIGAWLIVVFLVPVTLMMHKFWGLADANLAQDQMIGFMKNVSMLGGALLITQFGAGSLSLDARKSR